MPYTQQYDSPVGSILLIADSTELTGLYFNSEKYFARYPAAMHEKKETPLLHTVKRWLDIYFSGKEPGFTIPLHLSGTNFQNDVWSMLCTIPYGTTVSYGTIAKQIAAKRGLSRMSAQAVGGAVGRNKIPIIIPCHRVIGANGSLIGYSGGLDKKVKLLTLEGLL